LNVLARDSDEESITVIRPGETKVWMSFSASGDVPEVVVRAIYAV